VNKPDSNIIKLPNISASIPQLNDAIKELQDKGFKIPNYPDEPKTDEEKSIQEKYTKCLGSAVNPVLRQGNSDRRVAPSVKEYAKSHPHRLRDFDKNSGTHVAHMDGGDFYENEKSIVIEKDTNVRYEFVDEAGNISILKHKLPLLENEVLDGSIMSAKILREFIAKEIKDAKEKDVLFSVHLKATMMKISDPIIFGHFVSVYFKEIFDKYNSEFKELGINPNLGLGDIFSKIKQLPKEKHNEIRQAFEDTLNEKADLAMVDSDKGITNLHAPNLVIIDASMPPLIRDGGKMWAANGKMKDVKAIIPGRTYARFYQTVIEYIKENGAFDVATMGNVAIFYLSTMLKKEIFTEVVRQKILQ